MFDILKKRAELNLDIETMFRLFDVCVLPIATYGSEIWGFENLQIVEKLHLKFCKILLNLKRSTCSAMVYGETGRFPVSIVVYQKMFGFWYRLSSSRRNKLSDVMYQFLFKVDSNNPWYIETKKLLCTHGLNYVWMSNAKDMDYCYLKSKIQLILQDTFQQHWYSDITTSSKCNNYCVFKKYFATEKYLNILPADLRVPFARFRCRNTKIPVENYFISCLSDKKCKLCNLKADGDEYHYLLLCPFFDSERKMLLPRYYCMYAEKHKLYSLFNLHRPHLMKLAKFIKIVTKKLSNVPPTARYL